MSVHALDGLAADGRFLVLDVHSYNHRRGGPDALAEPAAGNPEVNVGTGALDGRRWEHAVATFVEALGDQRVCDHRLDVRVNVRFRGGYLCHWVAEHYPETACPLAIEFKKVFMDEWTGQCDDAHVSELREALGVAARRTARRVDGPDVTGVELRPSDLAIDRELADTASSIRFLLDVTPVNLIEARRKFFSDGATPEFVYGPLVDDPMVIETRLAAIEIDAVEDAALARILTSKRRELELQLQMLRCRGSDQFLELSLQLYGPVSPALLGEAEALLAAGAGAGA